MKLDRDLVVVDVGCRWGFAEPFINHLDKFRLFGFDPDRDECARLKGLYKSSRVTLMPLGLGSQEGKSVLHITQEPACSSIFEPDTYNIETLFALDCARKVAEMEIDLTTLDLWAERHGVKHVDHIKIDTQGSELYVLKGAERILENVRTLEVEVEFNPIYVGQPLFSDVDIFLRQRGFVLWKLMDLVHYGRNGESDIAVGESAIHYDRRSQSVGSYGGQLFWANAHYVRADIARSSFSTPCQLERDIVLLECLNHHDLAKRLKQIVSQYRDGSQV